MRTLALSLSLSALTGCEWFTDFKRQPSVTTWEALKTDSAGTPIVRGNPPLSVPIAGTTVPALAVSYAPMPATVDSMSGLPNPTPPSDSSLLDGQKYYAINCAVCHGDAGRGDGPATRFGMVPIPIVSEVTQARTDGYIFGIIRNGRGLMPSYNRIEEGDRWDVVNYVRALQGRLAGPPPTGPLGAPGITGAAVPGPTRLGPTRPVPYTPRASTPGSAPAGTPASPAASDTTRRTTGDTTRTGDAGASREETRS